ncbi:hypothetical protein UZ36_06775 [Candidatus Nitromaritima sp. SCGC AAA799-C22]|nr:hypothetical protein UZ36_06775 [Candidatus Nitromaritima sp. SCGC AAA799-C22]
MRRCFPRTVKWVLGLILIAWTVSGCGTANVQVYQYVEKNPDYPRSVAVLPFSFDPEISEGKRPHRILREVFFNFFSYLGYTDLPLDQVNHRLTPSLKAGTNLADIPHDRLGKILGTDAAIRGHVINATNFTAGVYAETSIKARIEMIDLRSGEVLWETEHTELNYSSIVTPAVVDIIKEQMENFEVKEAYYKAAESFAIKVLRKIPDPASLRENDVHLPRIVSIETNIRGNNKLKTDDLIYVTLQGEPNQKAHFDIGSFKSHLPMKEISPGLYTGSYRIKPEDRIDNALIIGCLTNRQGLTAKKFYKGAMAVIEEARAETGSP